MQGDNCLIGSPRFELIEALTHSPLSGARLNNLARDHWLADEPAPALVWARWANHPLVWGQRAIHVNARRTLANVLLDHGRYGEAENVLRSADPSLDDPEIRFALAQVLEGQGRWLESAGHAEARFCSETLPTGAFVLPQ